MIATDESAVICDFAETYHILDWRQLPVKLAATLAAGLRDNSRIMMKLSGEPVQKNVLLTAIIADMIATALSGFGGGKNRPPSFVNALLGVEPEEKKRDIRVFTSGEEFERARAKLLGGNHGV